MRMAFSGCVCQCHCPARPSTVQSSASRSSLRSRISATDGDSVIPGLIEGQRLSYVKPLLVSCDSGGKVVVGMKKQVPQGFWDYIEVALVNGPDQVKLKPTGDLTVASAGVISVGNPPLAHFCAARPCAPRTTHRVSHHTSEHATRGTPRATRAVHA